MRGVLRAWSLWLLVSGGSCSEWVPHKDPATGRTYYSNSDTQEVTWEVPDALAQSKPQPSTDAGPEAEPQPEFPAAPKMKPVPGPEPEPEPDLEPEPESAPRTEPAELPPKEKESAAEISGGPSSSEDPDPLANMLRTASRQKDAALATAAAAEGKAQVLEAMLEELKRSLATEKKDKSEALRRLSEREQTVSDLESLKSRLEADLQREFNARQQAEEEAAEESRGQAELAAQMQERHTVTELVAQERYAHLEERLR